MHTRSEKIATYRDVRTPTFDDVFRANAWSATHSTYQGIFDVCAYHEKYCLGEYRQYESFASCLTYMNALPDVPVGCPWAPFAGSSKPCKSKHKALLPFQPKAKHCYHIGPLTRADGSPNYDPDGQLKCSDDEECLAQTDFVLGEPTGEFLASMTAYDVAIADAYNDPLTNFSLDHYKFPQVVPTAM